MRVFASIEELADVSPVDGGVQVVTAVTVESDAGGKPVCVAETVSRLVRDVAR
ncbi:hypothetical protein [Micromonospora sp. WMMD975]|uniref:hypothetical protein n=1 Tax=Micromonospora sp. WMMD975 TaxID=3016087 RepID=UPI00249CF410|nr:hypothetical protein [Micromonospora sp. WMMD975]WFE35124.1 hypothetical protein O7613_07035 [Micromonospora sp. WMMD975]